MTLSEDRIVRSEKKPSSKASLREKLSTIVVTLLDTYNSTYVHTVSMNMVKNNALTPKMYLVKLIRTLSRFLDMGNMY